MGKTQIIPYSTFRRWAISVRVAGRNFSCRQAFTIVELLVSCAVVALLASLVSPAVMSAREASRKIACKNNLKQLGLAVQNYHDVYDGFPLGCVSAQTHTDPLQQDGYGWSASLLPYLDQLDLYTAIREPFIGTSNSPQGTVGVFLITYNRTGQIIAAGATKVSVFRCPSSQLPDHVTGAPLRHINGYATSDYKGSSGHLDTGLFLEVADAIAQNSRVIRHKDITDGASNTISLSESAYYANPTQWPAWVGCIYQNESCLFKTTSAAPINCLLREKSLTSMVTASSDDCAFSWHSGGAFFTFADGRVRFLTQEIDIQLYQRLGSRNDGEPVSLE